MLELCEELFDRIKVWTVRRQEQKMGARVADGFARDLAFVAAEVVEHDDVALFQGWDEYIFNIDTEEIAIDRSIDDPWSVDAVVAQRRNEGHCLPMAMRHKSLDPLTFRTPATQRRHVGLHPGLINKYQTLRIDFTLVHLPTLALAGNIRAGLFGWQYRFF